MPASSTSPPLWRQVLHSRRHFSGSRAFRTARSRLVRAWKRTIWLAPSRKNWICDKVEAGSSHLNNPTSWLSSSANTCTSESEVSGCLRTPINSCLVPKENLWINVRLWCSSIDFVFHTFVVFGSTVTLCSSFSGSLYTTMMESSQETKFLLSNSFSILGKTVSKTDTRDVPGYFSILLWSIIPG